LRAGYTWSHFLFYATAGGAAGDFRISTQPTGAGHNPTPPLGWTAGAGVEYLFTDAISAKIEYLYVNLGTVSCPAGTLCSSDNGEPTNLAKTIPSGSVSFTEPASITSSAGDRGRIERRPIRRAPVSACAMPERNPAIADCYRAR
jgi:hypothetical protein